jgi:hypothetical protein
LNSSKLSSNNFYFNFLLFNFFFSDKALEEAIEKASGYAILEKDLRTELI